MEFSAKVVAVESVPDGIVLFIQQEKMQIPVADEPENSDEAIIAKKIAKSFKMVGIPVQPMFQNPCQQGFRTGFWLPVEDYEALGKPTVGDVLKFGVEVEKGVKD